MCVSSFYAPQYISSLWVDIAVNRVRGKNPSLNTREKNGKNRNALAWMECTYHIEQKKSTSKRANKRKSFQTDIVVDQMNHAPNAFELALFLPVSHASQRIDHLKPLLYAVILFQSNRNSWKKQQQQQKCTHEIVDFPQKFIHLKNVALLFTGCQCRAIFLSFSHFYLC